MSLANDRDLTDSQWEILDDLIPKATPREDGRGRPWKDRRDVLKAFCGCCGRGLPGRRFPNVIRRTKPAIADFSNGSALE